MESAYKTASRMVSEEGRDKASAYISRRSSELMGFGGTIKWSTPYEVAEEFLAEKERRLRGEGPPPITSGFDEIDHSVRGWQPECMTVLGGYTNDGKSTAGLQLLTGMALRQTPVCYLSIEDRKQIPVKRQIQQIVRDESLAVAIANDALDFEHIHTIRNTISEDYFRNLPFCLEHAPGWDAEKAGYALQDAARNHGCRVGLVDYLQCFRTKGDRRVGLGDAAATLKTAACEVGMHLILISQIVRPEGRNQSSQQPNKFMLKESGDIENIAEYVAFIWRPHKGDDVAVEEAHFIVDKAKDASQVRIAMGWDTSRNCFTREPPTLND